MDADEKKFVQTVSWFMGVTVGVLVARSIYYHGVLGYTRIFHPKAFYTAAKEVSLANLKKLES
jgi:hypothetical protein